MYYQRPKESERAVKGRGNGKVTFVVKLRLQEMEMPDTRCQMPAGLILA
jgi:hypothetical protein